MVSQDTDRFLLKLIEDVAAIRNAVSTLESQMEKLDNRIVDPFQEWLHNVKVHDTDIRELKDEFKHLEDEFKKLEERFQAKFAEQEGKINVVENHLNMTKWYATGVVACLSIVGYAAYHIFMFLFQFIHLK